MSDDIPVMTREQQIKYREMQHEFSQTTNLIRHLQDELQTMHTSMSEIVLAVVDGRKGFSFDPASLTFVPTVEGFNHAD